MGGQDHQVLVLISPIRGLDKGVNLSLPHSLRWLVSWFQLGFVNRSDRHLGMQP